MNKRIHVFTKEQTCSIRSVCYDVPQGPRRKPALRTVSRLQRCGPAVRGSVKGDPKGSLSPCGGPWLRKMRTSLPRPRPVLRRTRSRLEPYRPPRAPWPIPQTAADAEHTSSAAAPRTRMKRRLSWPRSMQEEALWPHQKLRSRGAALMERILDSVFPHGPERLWSSDLLDLNTGRRHVSLREILF